MHARCIFQYLHEVQYLSLAVVQITKHWCMRRFFNEQTLAGADTADDAEYIKTTYHGAYDLSTPSGRGNGAILVLGMERLTMEMYDAGMGLRAIIYNCFSIHIASVQRR